eukprot:CAMPEP_0113905634 /NCGR_PEP_ID=MMETSP0780_2-20120614/24161_1 /TAXON_ID=652834 /ORGANISM="Palpitomonas bilix" /LENGTH=598 /DNA_ID=CAMNT_0000899865 /DNA_START=35 /DNA_END=1831 /DNA_ORIENTATION=- /assembly_acc=CAM_ASM_000599
MPKYKKIGKADSAELGSIGATAGCEEEEIGDIVEVSMEKGKKRGRIFRGLPDKLRRKFGGGGDSEKKEDEGMKQQLKPLTGAADLQRQYIHTACLMIIAILALGYMLYLLRDVLVPLLLALLFYYILGPLVDLFMCRGRAETCIVFRSLRRRLKAKIAKTRFSTWNKFAVSAIDFLFICRMPNWLATIIVLGIAFGFLTLVGFIIYVSIQQVLADGDRYRDTLATLVDIYLFSNGTSNTTYGGFSKSEILSYAGTLISPDLLLSSVDAAMGFMTSGSLALIFLIYLLLERDPDAALKRKKMREGKQKSTADHSEKQIKNYIVLKVLVSIATGALSGLLLWALGIPLAPVFGFLSFLLNFIPSVGSVLGTILPIPMAIVQYPYQPIFVVLTLVGPGFIQFFIGNIIEPRLLGDSMDIHPIVVMVSLMVWGFVWGIVGMVVSVPITAVMKIYLSTFDHPIPIYLARLLAGKFRSSETSTLDSVRLTIEKAAKNDDPLHAMTEAAAEAVRDDTERTKLGRGGEEEEETEEDRERRGGAAGRPSLTGSEAEAEQFARELSPLIFDDDEDEEGGVRRGGHRRGGERGNDVEMGVASRESSDLF